MKRFEDINVIPFIDIMLVLLAIVLTTATFISQGQIKIDVPQSSSKAAKQEQDSVQIAIDEQQQLYYQQELITLNDLELQLATLDTERSIIVSIDHTVPFQEFVNLLEVIKKQSFKNLSISTKKS